MKVIPQTNTSLILPYGDRRIRCEVRRSGQRMNRSVAIHVEPDGRVLIDAPLNTPEPEIRLAVTRRLGWIHRRLVDVESRKRLLTPREYVSGETILYLGRGYRLKVISTPLEHGARLRGGYLEVAVHDRSAEVVRMEVEKWFRNRAKEVLPKRLSAISEDLKWVKSSPPLSIRKMSRQWGSCSPKGRIALNIGLVHVPNECIDYVVLHELIHLKVHNHSRSFYRVLDVHLPDWQRRKSRLDAMADLALVH